MDCLSLVSAIMCRSLTWIMLSLIQNRWITPWMKEPFLKGFDQGALGEFSLPLFADQEEALDHAFNINNNNEPQKVYYEEWIQNTQNVHTSTS